MSPALAGGFFTTEATVKPFTSDINESESERRLVVSNFCNPMDHTVHEILQARTLKWVAVPFSRGSSQPRDQTQVSRITGGFFTI